MDLKERLALVRLNNRFKNLQGIKSFRITGIDILTKDEKKVLDNINKVTSVAEDKIPLNNSYEEYISWSKGKIKPFIDNTSEIIIIDSGKVIYILLDNLELFIEDYLKEKESFSIYILNKKIKKWIVIFWSENFLEYFNKDII